MSRKEKCHLCGGTGQIEVDDFLTRGMTDEEIAREKEEALADIVQVVRCKYCKHFKMAGTTPRCNFYKGLATTVNPQTDFCSYGKREEQ